ncbi:hypothetical protein B9479_004840 [Cryptococcus floricola]|uniref:Uncharacterized protein n=1 Tax=Cryptococcus floricola TaxID=2591691 RepID=A0A5D3AXE2_9TREE|nr:hypothetical protein B9479_004840 [Cryptococcus floricola]
MSFTLTIDNSAQLDLVLANNAPLPGLEFVVINTPSYYASVPANINELSKFIEQKTRLPIRREDLDASFEKRLRTVDGADAVIINIPTSADADYDIEGSVAKAMPAELTPVYFPSAPIGTHHTSLEKTPLDIFSHIHTSSDLELGLQAYNRIAPPTSRVGLSGGRYM